MVRSNRSQYQGGATLVELVMTIVVLAVGLSGIFSTIAIVSQHSADPMILQQSVNIAEAYLEEVASKSYSPQPNGAAGRASYDDVDDYNGLADAVATNQYGVAIAGLSGYAVTVSVALANDPLNEADWIALSAKRIDVTVTHAVSGVTITVSRYRVSI